MGYIIALVVLVVVVPLIFLLMSRRASAGGRGTRPSGTPVIHEMPASDQPTPGAPGSINQPASGAENRIPPG